MAATVSSASASAWSKPGAWALAAEEQEEELLRQKEKDNSDSSAQPLADFPSLATAASTKPKKKKGQTVSLSVFNTYGVAKATQVETLTPEELMALPTAPRQRTAEELERERSLGGGFKSYGRTRYSNGEDSSNSRWGSSRVSDEGQRRNGLFGSDSNKESASSRADEIDNWAAAKKSTVGSGFDRREDRRERGGFFDSQSKADESDSWVSNKISVPLEGRRFGSSSGGFERERKVGFGSNGGADSDNWGRKKVEVNDGSESGIGNGNGNGSVGGRPRLVLQPRTRPLSNGNQEGSGSVNGGVKPKGSNPFGDARPREEVLAEKGQDWKKIDDQLETMKIKEPTEKDNGFGRRSFGSGNRGASLSEDKTERAWRKNESVDSSSQSAENVENEEQIHEAEEGPVETN